MGREFIYGLMDLFIKEGSKMDFSMEKGAGNLKIISAMKDSIKTIESTEKEHILGTTELALQVILLKIKKLGKEYL